MKKNVVLMIVIIIVCFLTGCDLGNTPTSRVEELLGNYQRLDQNIDISYLQLTDNQNLDQEMKNRYEKLIRKQYQNLSYEVKEEKIDGEQAVVTVQVEVMDYKSTFLKYQKNNYKEIEYDQLILDDLEKVKEKITYTIEFEVTKNSSDKWEVDSLSSVEKEKLLGIYE